MIWEAIQMANCAIVGINWGDEGKGRMVDYLTNHFDVVVRYQGGGNAGRITRIGGGATAAPASRTAQSAVLR